MHPRIARFLIHRGSGGSCLHPEPRAPLTHSWLWVSIPLCTDLSVIFWSSSVPSSQPVSATLRVPTFPRCLSQSLLPTGGKECLPHLSGNGRFLRRIERGHSPQVPEAISVQLAETISLWLFFFFFFADVFIYALMLKWKTGLRAEMISVIALSSDKALDTFPRRHRQQMENQGRA